jgi:hypothetical protein
MSDMHQVLSNYTYKFKQSKKIIDIPQWKLLARIMLHATTGAPVLPAGSEINYNAA